MKYYFVSLISFVIIVISLLVYIFNTRKLIKNLLINKELLFNLNSNLQNISYSCNIDSKRTFSYVSENIFQLSGHKPIEFINNKDITFIELIHKDDRLLIQDKISSITRDQKSYNVEYRIITQWGGEKWVKEQGIGIYNRKGELISIQGILTDITDIKCSEEFLKESENRFQLLIKHAPVGICIFYQDMITFVNPVYQNMFGFSTSNEILGSSLINCIAPHKRIAIEKLISQNTSGIKYNTGIETIGIRQDGSEFFIEIFLTSVVLGDFMASLGYFIDISEHKRSEGIIKEAEERYRSVFDQSGLASNVFDLSGKLIMQNTLAAKYLGGETENFSGKHIDEIFPAESSKIIKHIMSKTLRNGNVVDEREMPMPTGKMWIRTTSHAVHENSNDVIGIQLISQNITEKKTFDSKLLTTIIETEEKERMHFSQELHDGLGPIISAIKCYVQWLSRPGATAKLPEILSDTERLIDQAAQTIREISFKLSPPILTKSGFIEAVISYAEQVNRTNCLKINVTHNFSDRMEINSEKVLYRVVCECITNTIKHANASLIEIKILQLQGKYKIIISDNGNGFNVDSIFTNKTGNGLFNIQSRLQSINGYLKIKSSPELGTKIYLTIRPT